MADLCDRFVERAVTDGLAAKTHAYYLDALKPWRAWCAARGLDDPREVGPEDLGAYSQSLRDRGLSPHTVANRLRAVRALFSWAKLQQFLELNPWDNYRLRSPKLPIQRGFTPDDVKRMVARTQTQTENAYRDRALVLLFFDSGIRLDELCGLRLGDVLDEQDRLLDCAIVTGKGSKQRRVPLHPQTQRALWAYLTEERRSTDVGEALFLNRRGAPLAPTGVYSMVKRLAHRAGLVGKRLSPHTFRHGFAKVYLDQDGARLDDLQALLGHESISMSQHYAKLQASSALRASRALSPVGQMGLQLGRRLQRGRPRKSPG